VRLSSLVVAVLLLVSTVLLAQHSFASGGSSPGGGVSSGGLSGGASHSGSSGSGSVSSSHGGSGGSGSSHGSSSASSSSGRSGAGSGHSASTRSSTGSGNSIRAKANPPTHVLEPSSIHEKKGFWGFLRHKKPAPPQQAWIAPPKHCKKGQYCPSTCQAGYAWNGLACGVQYEPYWWFNSCSSLAAQLQAQRERLREHPDPGESLIYRTLLDQYQLCLQRSGFAPFSFYALDEANLFGIP